MDEERNAIQEIQQQQLQQQQTPQAQAEAQPQPELLNEGEYNPGHENCSAVVQCFV
jgi:hypothetical protein